jgi:anti-sigma regulatory factor (Ser/Thr protein kinase)
MAFGWRRAEREVFFAMAGTQETNGRLGLRPAFAEVHATRSLLKIEAWMPSEIKAISPLVNRLMRLIEGSRCVAGNESAVELALQEALSNAVVHGHRMDAHKLVQVRCQCELGKGVSIVVTDQGQGFDPKAVPDPLAIERLEEEHGRGLHLMKLAMDEVWFRRGGSEVQMRKGPVRNPKTDLRGNNETVYRGSLDLIQRGPVVAVTQAHTGSRHER